MALADFTLLAKKILIGILVALVPFLILFFGLRLTQKLLKPSSTNTPIHTLK
jgi:hypothetical protein